ncbi:MAG TPA: cytochrome c maturation protein CcmE [Methylophilaceae bacterium]|nr:cytochrome c maturation protein CcmE [Methylophilaceae bacterium]
MKARHKRLILIVVGLALLGIAAMLITKSFRSNLVFFFTPTQVENGEAPKSGNFRIGGLVEQGSLKRLPDGLHVQFKVTDTAKSMLVEYKGILPDLFKEGKGVVAEGELNQQHVFVANQVLAKHDENYMPPEAAEALKKAKANQPQSMETIK